MWGLRPRGIESPRRAQQALILVALGRRANLCFQQYAALPGGGMGAAMSDEPENFTLALLRKIDGKVDSLREEMATKSDVADVSPRSIRCAPTWPRT